MSNTNTNQKHPLINFLDDMGMDDWLAPHNFTAYKAMKKLLRLDGKPTEVGDNSLVTGFEQPIHWCSELVSDQSRVIYSMVASWAGAVMQQMVDALNACSDEELQLSYDGCPETAVMNFYYMESFFEGVGSEGIETIKAVLKEWHNSCSIIENMPIFLMSVDARAKELADNSVAVIADEDDTTQKEGAYDVLFEIMTGDHIIHNEVRVTHATSEDEATQFALEAEFGGDEDSISEQLALIKSGEAKSVKNHDETLSYKPVMVIPLQEVEADVTLDGKTVKMTVLVPCETINAFNGTRYYKY